MKKIIVLLCLILLSSNALNAQTQVWVNDDQGRGAFDKVHDMVVTSSGNTYICGQTDDNTVDYLIAKYNASGYLVWWELWDGPNNDNDIAAALTLDASENVYVTGKCNITGYESDIGTVKYNSSGVFQWAAVFNSPSTYATDDYGTDIKVDAAGSIHVLGTERHSTNIFTTNVRLLRYNTSGTQTSSIELGSSGSDYSCKLATDGTSLYVTAGVPGYYQSIPGTSWYYGIYTYKYSLASGLISFVWARRYDGFEDEDDFPVDIKISSAGKIVVAGKSIGDGTNYDYVVISMDPNIGENEESAPYISARYNGPVDGDDIPSSIAVDGSGGIIVTGKSPGSSTGLDYATVKYNYLLQHQWTARYNGSGSVNDYANDITTDASNNIYVTGTINENSGITQGDYGTIKYNSTGTQQWLANYSYSSANDQGHFVGVGESNSIYVSGWTDISSNYRIALVKYSQSSEEEEDDKFAVKEDITNSINNYPNPFNPTTMFHFNIKDAGNVKIEVFNALGQNIQTLTNSTYDAGSHTIEFNGSALSSGLYFYKITTDNFTETKKMLLVK